MKIVFMGTPDFAVEMLERIIKEGHEVTLAVTQPDKAKGRGKELCPSPVKTAALLHNIPVFQPVKIRDAESVSKLREYEADIFVVAAFGQILSEEILNMPRFGCINVHASLLPKYRGAAPIQWALLDGCEKTGVTIQQMAKGVDTGDIISQKELVIAEDETGESLFEKLMYAGAELLAETLPNIENNRISPQPQNEAEATYASKISKEMGLIDWKNDGNVIERYVRGLNSWPSAYTILNGKILKIWESKMTSESSSEKPGTVIEVTGNALLVNTGTKVLEISQVQLEGKKRMSVHDFLLGYDIKAGTVLG